MIKTVNLANQIRQQLPTELVEFMQTAGQVSTRLGQKLYLVGGAVRDMLLERTNLDLDLVAEVDAIELASEMAKIKHGKVIAHSRFSTAKIKWDKWSVDIATTRVETYEKPGSLPTVQCGGNIENDLIRRDFTINALAVYLDPRRFGELIDLYNGIDDLKRGYIRILHDNSFKDDATRIWRAVRYEQRLDFVIEHHTLELIKRDLPFLDSLTGDRVRHELELVLEEEKPEKGFLRAEELGLLSRISPHLTAGDWLARKMSKARSIMQPYCPPKELYLALLIYRLLPPELEDLLTYFKFPRAISQTLLDTLKLKSEMACLKEPGSTSSRIYHCLHQYSLNAILANLITSDSLSVRQRIELYLEKLRHIQPLLTGEDLINMGIESGPRIKETLDRLREAKLDGFISSRSEELEMVRTQITAKKVKVRSSKNGGNSHPRASHPTTHS
jgi:tRNA nucleotidyltransferase (CCA-adding enzyme)